MTGFKSNVLNEMPAQGPDDTVEVIATRNQRRW